jgi:DMSO/TMAO reductase YedYZ molybdopterin-dependent catalytic subunit
VLYGLLIAFLLNTLFLVLVDQEPFAARAFGPGLDSAIPLWAGLTLLALVYAVTLYGLLPPLPAVAQADVESSVVQSNDRRQLLRIGLGALLSLVGGGILVGAGTLINQGGLTSPVNRVGEANPDNASVEDVPGDPDTPTPETAAQAQPDTPTPRPPVPTDTAAPAPTSTTAAAPTEAPVDPSTGTPEPLSTDTPVPTDTPLPTETPLPTATPLPAIKVQEITPVGSFYHVSKNFFDPSVSANGWKLQIKGLVSNPYSLDYKQLTSMTPVKVTTGMMCISNPVGGGLIGNTTWKGVRLGDLIKRARPKAGVTKVVMRAADDYSDSISYDKAQDPDVVLVWEMGGAPLTSEHGFPARLLVPGIYGMKHVKWIQSIELVNYDFKGYWQEPNQGWSDPAPVNTMSRIDFPSEGVLTMKPQAFSGIAFAGDRSISKVEISTDGGKTWNEAYLKQPKSHTSWVVWGYTWTPPAPGVYKVQVRATDGNGNMQSAKRTDPYPNGAKGYHTISYKVKATAGDAPGGSEAGLGSKSTPKRLTELGPANPRSQ